MKDKPVPRMLASIGLSAVDTEVYICLAKHGPRRVSDLTNELKFSKNEVEVSLKKLQDIRMVTPNIKHQPLFFAKPFNKSS